RSMVETCGISTVLTSRAHLEDVRAAPNLAQRIVDVPEMLRDRNDSWLVAAGLHWPPPTGGPRGLGIRDGGGGHPGGTILLACSPESPNTPRGALLSHHNLLSNLEALRQVLDVTPRDAILGLLPFSNAMSFATTLWLPVLSGARVVYGLDRLHEGLGEL